ncbi:MAG: hypothetical protein AB7F67_06045 [Rhodospirillaceae bacterium]
MSASIVAIGDLLAKNRGWTEQQRADLFRVAEMLNRAGMRVATECGMSDEGDPWFVFASEDTGEVIAHFARIDGFYVAASVTTGDTIRARSFKDVVEGLIRHQPLARDSARSRWSEVHANPIAALAAFVAAALIVSREKPAEAGSTADAPADPADRDRHDDAAAPAARAETVHAHVVAAVRAAPPSAETAAGGWEWLSIARAGLAVAMIAVTDAFAFAFDHGDDAAPSDDLTRIGAVQDSDGSRAERDHGVQAGVPAEHVRPVPADHVADPRHAAVDGDDLRHDGAAIVLNEDPAGFVFHPATPESEEAKPAALAAAPAEADLAATQRAADVAAARPTVPQHLDADNVSLHGEVAAKPAAKAEPAAPEATPTAVAAADTHAVAHVEPPAEAAATPAFEVSKGTVESVAGAKTFVIGNAELADHFSLVTSLKTVKLFDAADALSSSSVAKIETSASGLAATTAADPLRLSSQDDDSFLTTPVPTAPQSASVSLSNGSGELSSFDGGRFQTIRLGSEADVVMVTPGLSHIRIENFTAGVDRFYISQWLLDHAPPDVSITAGGDVVMSFHGSFSVTLVGLVAPQPEFPVVA